MARHDIRSLSGYRLGKGMVVVAWILFLGMLTLLFQSFLEHQNNPNRQLQTRVGDQGSREVVLERNRAGHYVASGRINGRPVTFLLDTGATDVALPEGLAKALRLPRGAEVITRTAAGLVISRKSRLDTVTLGGIELRNVRATILSRMEGDEVLLGMSFLEQLELVQREGTLTLRQH